jgi:hypothetical protein
MKTRLLVGFAVLLVSAGLALAQTPPALPVAGLLPSPVASVLPAPPLPSATEGPIISPFPSTSPCLAGGRVMVCGWLDQDGLFGVAGSGFLMESRGGLREAQPVPAGRKLPKVHASTISASLAWAASRCPWPPRR